MTHDLAALVRRLETAQALQSRAFLLDARRRKPDGPARALHGPWGFAHFVTEGHGLNQAQALGLHGVCPPRVLDRLEALLGQGGHPVVLELAPTADPELPGHLAARGYAVRSFQQALVRDLSADLAAADEGEVRPIRRDQLALWQRVVEAGFLGSDELPDAPALADGFGLARGNTLFLAWEGGLPVGAGVLGCFGRVAVLSGTSVLPGARGRGLQRALVAARLRHGRARGCDLACSAVLPGTASQANLERCGFRVAYPKLELARGCHNGDGDRHA